MADNVKIKFTADGARDISKDTKAIISAINDLRKVVKSTNPEMEKQVSIWKEVVKSQIFIQAANQLKEFSLMGVKAAAEFETLGVAFNTLLGSEKEAVKLLADIQKAAATTPFEVSSLAKVTQAFLGVGLSADKALETSLQFGDVLAAFGKGDVELQRVSNTISQVFGKGKADVVDFKELVNAGWATVRTDVAETLQMTSQEFEQALSKGEIGFEEIQQTLNRTTGEGGRFFDAMTNQSKTLTGQLSNLKDSMNLALGGLVTETGILDTIKKVVSGLSSFFGAIKNNIGLIKVLGSGLVVIGGFFAGLLTLGKSVAIIKSLSLAFKALTAVLAANPIAFILLGIISAVVMLKKAWDENLFGIKEITETVVNRVIDALNWMIKQINKVGKHFGQTIPEIERFKLKVDESADSVEDMGKEGERAGQKMEDSFEDTNAELDKTLEIIGEVKELTEGLNFFQMQDEIKENTYQWEEQNQELSEAKKNYDDIVKTHGENSTEARKAFVEWERINFSVRRTEEDTNKLILKTQEYAEQILANPEMLTDEEVRKFADMAEQIDASGDSIQTVTDNLGGPGGLIEQIRNIPTERQIKIDVRTQGLKEAFNQISSLFGFGGRSINIGTSVNTSSVSRATAGLSEALKNSL